MEQEDRLKKQIDQLGKVLGTILAKLLGVKTRPEASILLKEIHQSLQSEALIDVEALLELDPTRITGHFLQKDYSLSNLELLADILYHLPTEADETRKVELLERALALYEYIQLQDVNYSLERLTKINRIKAYLE